MRVALTNPVLTRLMNSVAKWFVVTLMNASRNELCKFGVINVQMIRRHLDDFLCTVYI